MDELNKILAALTEEARRKADIVEPWHSFWYHRPHLNFPPRTIRDVSEYDGSDRLSLACTQTDLPAREQKQLVQKWCDHLPGMAGIRFLWLQSRATQELFDAACQMPDLEGLYIKWGAIKSSVSLSRLKKLKYLHFGSAPSLEPMSVFSGMTQLRWLELVRIATGLTTCCRPR